MTDDEKKAILNEQKVSEDELDAVIGGVRINWPAECKATVEDGSSCWGTDACYTANVIYKRDRNQYGCSQTVSSNSWCAYNDNCKVVLNSYKWH